MKPNISTILESQENIIWQGVISRKVINVYLLLFLIIIFVVSVFIFTQNTIIINYNEQPKEVSGFLIGTIFAVLSLGALIYWYLSSLVKEYTITTKRVVVKSGLIGTDFKSIEFDQIRNAEVNVSIVGKIFSVGTIKIDTGKTATFSTGNIGNDKGGNLNIQTKTMYDELINIDNPYDVYKHIRSAISTRKENLYSGKETL